MTDLIFNHTKESMLEALGINKSDLKKFFIDVEDYMEDRKGKHSQALEFIWSSDQSFEMKIASTFTLGGIVTLDMEGEPSSIASFKAIPVRVLKELFEAMKKDGLL
jgi:hypothetical protein